jgi:hypothetical protein
VTQGPKYHEVLPITRAEAEAAFSAGAPETVADALLSIAYHESDWRWVQGWCLQNAKHEDIWVRRTAVTCFGHLARIHHDLDEHLVLPSFEELRSDSELSGWVDDALDDIRMFLKKSDA